MKRLSGARFFGLIAGLNVAVGAMFYVVTLPPPVQASAPLLLLTPRVMKPLQGIPTRISIPSLRIDLPVATGSYDATTASWTVDATKAFYADMSVPINDQNGTTLIYGHAQAPVFAALPDIQPGAEAIVTTDTGYRFYYHYVSQREVAPTNTDVFDSGGPPTLVVQTCIGDWSAYRGLFSFTLDKVEKV